MTAVLLTILKIIGIVLLVILGILLFLLAVILFVPVRYSVKGTVDNNITAEGKISWLCSILRYDFTFQEQELNGEVRIFGFRPKKKKRVSETELEDEIVSDAEDVVENVVKETTNEATETLTEEKQKSTSTAEKSSEEKKKSTSSVGKIIEEKQESISIEENDLQKTEPKRNKRNKASSVKSVFRRIYDKIQDILKKIKNKFQNIRKKISSFKDFVVKVKDIVTDEKNQYAVRQLWKELLYLTRHFGFRKIHTELSFCLADPALTGQVLGVLCMIPFLYQYDFHIYPDFESESYYIRGEYDVKGRIQLIFLLITFIRIVADKDMRYVLKKLLDQR